MKIEISKKKDVEIIVGIAKKVLPIYYDKETTSEFIKNYIAINAILKKKNVGFLLAKMNNKNIHIHSIGVDKNYRRKGVGSSLISFLKVYDYNNLSLNVSEMNTEGIAFYKRLGFINILFKKDYYDCLKNNNAYLMYLTRRIL